ncbi:hypothetical protein MPTK1_1g27710 [Marchantia polymorpha subsp. ruderalis]|uniref:RING-type domain-containing protein n=2 Tax=Marchantia polymorpha TaxID=3197 RepID=A0AAF6AUY5_MARPO|nr:hypothetical protein MARPO_0002s0107 [Marchantia polymorpha]BBN00256.1 hypothetical protein Mp_1g27710 [Marchantia polymorpha subsp. ruderalis]|eukprot:PTQ49627.1 hypothetical protein MARPO_0002s0107 [Marchantia polymorpha]
MGAVRDEGVVGRCGELSEDEEADPEKLCSRFSPKLLDGEAESRTCGICSIVVQTRGLLDCCSHLFCFGCITEWFTVSNLCPLCKSRSRFITPQMLSRGTGCWEKLESCTGSVSRDEGPGDEDGHPVSFPPYFIDEEAVLCLEGDACLVRAGLLDLDAEENASSDTSVACDLCDCWYHGGCVNFQPDQSSFHCPRCLESKEKDRASLDTSVSLTVTSSEEKTSTVMKNFPSEDNGRTMFGGASVAIEDTEEGESHVSISLLRIPEREPARAQTTAPDTEREIMWSPIREPFATPAYGAAWSHFQEPSRRPRNFNEGLPSSAREPTRNVPYFEEEMWSPTREPSGKVPQFQEELWSPTRETPGDLSLLGARSRNNAATAKSFRAANPPKPELNARGPRVVVPTRSELLNNSERIAKHSAGVAKKVTASEISGATLPLNTMDNIVQPLGVIKGELSIDVDRLQVAVEQLRKGKRKVLQEDERNIDFKDLPELPRKVARKSTKIVDSVAAIKDIAKTGTRDLIVCEQTAVEDVNPPAQVCTLDDKTVVASEDTLKVATDVVKEEALDTQHAQAIDAPIHLHVSERKTEVDGLDDKSRVISEEISKVVTEVETAGQITPCLKSLDDLATKTESTEVRNEEQLATLQSEEPTAPETKTEIPTLEACPDVDVMDIVSDPRSGLGRDSKDPSVPTKAVRTRIIMHRESDVKDKERPSLVERIRQQMRDTAGYGAGDDLGKVEVSDDRFIAAFKAAQTRSYEKSKDGKSASSRQQSSGRLWKVLDKKYSGTGARDNLTRKLYAGGTGRRCWDRDWDIAFWRERDPHQRRARKEAEEVDVLGKIDARVPESQPDSEDADFFKRLYVADTSLFPRNENVKPLSEEGNHAEEINASQSVEIRTGKISNLHVDNVNLAHGLKDTAHRSPVSQGLSGNTPGIDKISQKAKVGDPPPSKVVKKSLRPSGVSKEPAVNSKTTSGAGKSLVAPSTVPKAQHKDKDAPSALPSMNKDKRQWALEILARKEGKLSNVSASGKGAGAGGSVSKDNPFPLLLQLPVEMRPLILGDSRRSKVPPAVRQVQLNRLVEQELKRANLTIIESNSECADAIAKAVSREEELCKSSNSKGVYINRCVRALANTDYELKTVETSPDDDRDESEARLEESSRVTDDEAVRKALEDTGLMDSPTADSTSSPHHLDVNTREDKLDVKCKTLDMNGGSSIPRLVQNPWVENVLEVENADLDIYGDFEFSSEDEPDGNLFKENIQKLKHNPAAEGKAKNGSLMVVLTTGSCTSDAASVPGDAEVPAKNLVGKQPVQEQGGALLCSEDGGVRASTSPTVEDVKCGLPAEASFDDVDDMYDNLELNLNPVLSNEVLAQLQAEPSASLLSKAESKETHEESKTLPAPNADVKKRKENETLPNGDAAANENVSEDDCMKFADIDRRIENIRRSKAMNGDSHRNKKSKGRVHGEAKKTTETNVQMQVEIYVNQHLKPLYRSQVITAEQFKWTVSKTAAKVMEHHGNAVSADFLISEGSKVKKLADQYLQAFAHRKA